MISSAPLSPVEVSCSVDHFSSILELIKEQVYWAAYQQLEYLACLFYTSRVRNYELGVSSLWGRNWLMVLKFGVKLSEGVKKLEGCGFMLNRDINCNLLGKNCLFIDK